MDIVISRSPWYYLFRLHVPLSCSCEWTALDFVPVTHRSEISLLVATRVSYNMHEGTHLHNLQSLAGCELIQCFYQCRFQWKARLKEKKDLNNQNKSVTPQNVLSNKAALANAKKVKVVQSFSIPKVPYLLEKAPRCLWNIWTCRQSAYFRATGAGLIKNFVFASNTLLHNIPFFFNVLFESDNNGTWRT